MDLNVIMMLANKGVLFRVILTHGSLTQVKGSNCARTKQEQDSSGDALS